MKIDEIYREVKEEAHIKADNLDIDLDFTNENPTLSVGDETYNLPEMPGRS